MKLSRILLVFFVFSMMVNCAKDEEPTPEPETEESPVSEIEEPQEPQEPETEVYFTFNVGSSYESAPPTSEQVQNWIIIHDTEGNLMDYKSFENGDQLVFEKIPEDIPEQLNITIFNHHFRIKEYRHELETYPNIKKGSKWFLNTYRYNSNEEGPSGSFNQTINNIPNPQGGTPFYSVSTSTRTVPPSSTTGSSVFGETDLVMENIPFYENREYLFVVEDRKNRVCRYMFIEPTSNSAQPELDFADFTPVTLGANFSFPPTKSKSFLARGLTSGQSYNNRAFTLMDGVPIPAYPVGAWSNRYTVQIPIIETFDKFQTVVQMVMDDYKWFYRKQGDYPNNTFVPDKPIVEFVNESIDGFIINTDLDYQRKVSSWFIRNDTTDDTTAVTIRKTHSTNTTYPTLGQIPEELTALYPHIDLANVTYLYTEFHLRSESYTDFIFHEYETNADYWNRDLELEILTLFKEE